MVTGDDMRINTKFPVAVHMMTLISYIQKMDKTATSEILAKSVGTNPVVIRQIMSLLRKSGPIETRNGASGIYLVKKKKILHYLIFIKQFGTTKTQLYLIFMQTLTQLVLLVAILKKQWKNHYMKHKLQWNSHLPNIP